MIIVLKLTAALLIAIVITAIVASVITLLDNKLN